VTTYEKSGSITAGASLSGAADVERGLEGIRLAVFGILLGVGLGAASLTSGWWLLLAGFGSVGAIAFAIWWPPSRRWLMALMYRITRV
jgi:hypothetical protein